MDSTFNVKTTDGEEVRIVRAYAADGARPFESRVLEAEDGRTLRPLGGGMAEVIEILDDAAEVVIETVTEKANELVDEVKETVGDAAEAVGDAAGAALDQLQDALTGGSEEEPIPGTKPEEETPAA
jgi:hypothetical protein